MHFWPKFGNTDFNWLWLFARTSSRWGKFLLLSSIWPWSSRSIVPKNYSDLNQGLLHLWSKFSDSSLSGWWVIARTSWWLTDRHTHTHAGNDNTRRPKLASGKNLIVASMCICLRDSNGHWLCPKVCPVGQSLDFHLLYWQCHITNVSFTDAAWSRQNSWLLASINAMECQLWLRDGENRLPMNHIHS